MGLRRITLRIMGGGMTICNAEGGGERLRKKSKFDGQKVNHSLRSTKLHPNAGNSTGGEGSGRRCFLMEATQG